MSGKLNLSRCYCLGLLLTLLLPLSGWANSYNKTIVSDFGDTGVLQLVSECSMPEQGVGEVQLRVLTASAGVDATFDVISRNNFKRTYQALNSGGQIQFPALKFFHKQKT